MTNQKIFTYARLKRAVREETNGRVTVISDGKGIALGFVFAADGDHLCGSPVPSAAHILATLRPFNDGRKLSATPFDKWIQAAKDYHTDMISPFGQTLSK